MNGVVSRPAEVNSMRLAILSLLIVGAFATTNNDALWHQWKRVYNKEYNGQEDAHRRAIWEQNVQHIQEHNLKHDLGMVTYTLGLNQFTDMTFEEFKAKYLSPVEPVSESIAGGIPFHPTNCSVPRKIDWREYGYVTEVKNQKSCRSFWAFSATGAVEAQYKKKYRILKSFSEQQLLDCSAAYDNKGCLGGLMENSFRYLRNNGLEQESDYPYKAKADTCKYKPLKGVVKVHVFYYVHSGSERDLRCLVGQNGPVSVAIHVERDFMMYKTGIFRSFSCSTRNLNHGVLIVGYGNQRGHDFWMVKNSWGSSWGVNGYIRMARNRQNMCGIASLASLPLVENV